MVYLRRTRTVPLPLDYVYTLRAVSNIAMSDIQYGIFITSSALCHSSVRWTHKFRTYYIHAFDIRVSERKLNRSERSHCPPA